MNVYDSERMVAALEAQGYARSMRRTTRIWWCSTPAIFARRPPRRSILSWAGCGGSSRAGPGCASVSRAASRRPKGPRCSCGAPTVDIVVGPQAYHRLPRSWTGRGGRSARSRRSSRPRTSSTTFRGPQRKAESVGFPDRAGRLRQVLHLLRGPLHPRRRVSRPASRIVAEARSLVARGAVEITLLGQNVNAWRRRRGDRARRADRAARRDRGVGAPPLHHLPSARHGDGSDRGARRGAKADAVPALASASRASTGC